MICVETQGLKYVIMVTIVNFFEFPLLLLLSLDMCKAYDHNVYVVVVHLICQFMDIFFPWMESQKDVFKTNEGKPPIVNV